MIFRHAMSDTIEPDTPVSPGHHPKNSTPTTYQPFQKTYGTIDQRSLPSDEGGTPPSGSGDLHDCFDIGIGWWKAVAACTLLPNLPY